MKILKKSQTYIFTLGLFIVFTLLLAGTAIAGNITAQEYGDPVYRDLGVGAIEYMGHAAIFSGVDSSDTDYVIVMDATFGIYGSIHEIELSEMIGSYTYWGAFQSTNLESRPDTFSERQTIIQHANELDTEDPGYTLGGVYCIDPKLGWDTQIQPDEVDDIRCDGVVEYCYEYSTEFPIWGKNGTNYDISKYPSEHNVVGYENPDTEFSPMVQCGQAGGTSTYLTNDASIDYPNIAVSSTPYSGRTVVNIRASDQSGIHKILYKWGISGAEQISPYNQHPTQDYQEVVATTYSTSDLYVWVQDGAGNANVWHPYPIIVATPTPTPTPNPSFANDLISWCYLSILDRDPSQGEIDAWRVGYFEYYTGLNIDVKLVASQMAWEFFKSAEYAARGRTDQEFAYDCYLALLDREPASGETNWCVGYSKKELFSLISKSAECSSWIESIFPNSSGDLTRNFITTFYIGILDRLPNSSELTTYVNIMNRAYLKKEGAKRLATALFNSSTTMTNSDRAESLYRIFKGRFPTSQEKTSLTMALNSRRLTLYQAINVFANSPEFNTILNEYF